MGEMADYYRAQEIGMGDDPYDDDERLPRRYAGTRHSRLTEVPVGDITLTPPKEIPMSTLLARNVAIKGQHFLPPNERQTVAAIPADNDNHVTITLIPEPENEHDPLAVRAEIDGRKIGYLAAEISPLVVWLMKEGVNVQFIASEKNKLGNFIGKVVML